MSFHTMHRLLEALAFEHLTWPRRLFCCSGLLIPRSHLHGPVGGDMPAVQQTSIRNLILEWNRQHRLPSIRAGHGHSTRGQKKPAYRSLPAPSMLPHRTQHTPDQSRSSPFKINQAPSPAPTRNKPESQVRPPAHRLRSTPAPRTTQAQAQVLRTQTATFPSPHTRHRHRRRRHRHQPLQPLPHSLPLSPRPAPRRQ